MECWVPYNKGRNGYTPKILSYLWNNFFIWHIFPKLGLFKDSGIIRVSRVFAACPNKTIFCIHHSHEYYGVEFLNLSYFLQASKPPRGHFSGKWQPSIEAHERENCHSCSVSNIFSLKRTSSDGRCAITLSFHKLLIIDLLTSLTIVHTVETPTPAIPLSYRT